jgi:hypothetical protein
LFEPRVVNVAFFYCGIIKPFFMGRENGGTRRFFLHCGHRNRIVSLYTWRDSRFYMTTLAPICSLGFSL